MSNVEEKMEASIEEEKVAHVETIPYVSPASENNSETSDEVETDIIETFSETDDEELLVEASISQAARDLEASLLGEITGRSENNKETEDVESLACSVCYTALNKNNIVNTPCKHNFCWECFFKWIHTAPTCPMCRKNFVSENAWYENRDVESDRNDLRELVNIYQRELVGLSMQFKDVNSSIKRREIKLSKLRRQNAENLSRLISTRQQISYNEGYIAGQKDKNNRLFKPKFIKQESILNSPWFQGYSKAQWELRFTDRHSSGPRMSTIINMDGIDELDDFNKHYMGFNKIVNKKNKCKNKDEEVRKKFELAANTPLPDDSSGEEKN